MKYRMYKLPTMDPVKLFKSLADDTRLKCVLLIQQHEELCVCELTAALDLSQPKISRHLALLREAGLLRDHRQGQWVFYRLDPALPGWVLELLATTHSAKAELLKQQNVLLQAMTERPVRLTACGDGAE